MKNTYIKIAIVFLLVVVGFVVLHGDTQARTHTTETYVPCDKKGTSGGCSYRLGPHSDWQAWKMDIDYYLEGHGGGGPSGGNASADGCITPNGTMWTGSCWNITTSGRDAPPICNYSIPPSGPGKVGDGSCHYFGTLSNSGLSHDFKYFNLEFYANDATWNDTRYTSRGTVTTHWRRVWNFHTSCASCSSGNPKVGETFRISWNSEQALQNMRLRWSGALGSGNIPVAEGGSEQFTCTTTGNTTFSTDATGPSGNGLKTETTSVVVTCDPGVADDPVVNLSADRYTIDPNERVTFSWNVTGTVSHCMHRSGTAQWADPEFKSVPSGSESVTDITATKQFGIKCWKLPSGGPSTEDYVTITVRGGPTPTPGSGPTCAIPTTPSTRMIYNLTDGDLTHRLPRSQGWQEGSVHDADIPEGEYNVILDGWDERPESTQNNEQFNVRFRPRGVPTTQLAQTGNSYDIVDGQNHSPLNHLPGTLTLPSGVGNYYAGQVSQTQGDVLAVCFALDPVIGNDASCVGEIDAPDTVNTGQTFEARVTMWNTGSNQWDNNTPNPYRLISRDESTPPRETDRWGTPTRIRIPNSPVLPNESATFVINATAPDTPGDYGFNWNMSETGIQAFGQLCTKTITVRDAPTLGVQVTATPDEGDAPLNPDVEIRLTGTATGPTNYYMYFECDYNGKDKDIADSRCGPLPSRTATGCEKNDKGWICINDTRTTITLRNANAPTYTTGGEHRFRAIVERDSLTAWGGDRINVTSVNNPPTGTDYNAEVPAICGTFPKPVISWTYVDPDDVPPGTDPQTAFQVQVDDDPSFTSIDHDSSKRSSSASSYTVNTGLDLGRTYYFRVKVWDSSDLGGVWEPASPLSFTMLEHGSPTVAFSWEPTDISVERPINFTDETTSGYPISSRVWDFDCTSPTQCDIGNSTEQNPTNQYYVEETFDTRLTVTAGPYTCSAQTPITIGEANPIPDWREVNPN